MKQAMLSGMGGHPSRYFRLGQDLNAKIRVVIDGLNDRCKPSSGLRPPERPQKADLKKATPGLRSDEFLGRTITSAPEGAGQRRGAVHTGNYLRLKCHGLPEPGLVPERDRSAVRRGVFGGGRGKQ